MATLNKPQGTYKKPVSVGWNPTAEDDTVIFTVNGLSPTLSEVIAYDDNEARTPFLAVTQDGLGRVVYDGGFPKYYNNQATGARPASLTASFRFLLNAINWVHNPARQKKVLILGDAAPGEHYCVAGNNGDDFYVSLSTLCATAGFEPVFKTRLSYGGMLNPTAQELNSYSCVLLMSSVYTGQQLITDEGISALIGFRESGNGLILITDHGENLDTIRHAEDAIYSGFFKTANCLAVHFGAFFSGTIDRAPVNVGHIRA